MADKTPRWDDFAKINASPLRVEIKNGKLQISIGIGTMAYCVHEGHRKTWKGLVVTDPEEFARDVAAEMTRENELGDTPLSRFLSKMNIAALNEGSAGVAKGETDGRY